MRQKESDEYEDNEPGCSHESPLRRVYAHAELDEFAGVYLCRNRPSRKKILTDFFALSREFIQFSPEVVLPFFC
jgi:hypothetical protein